MSTIVYQSFESCLESQLKESTTLKLKLLSPKAVSSLHDHITSETPCEIKQAPYVDPSNKYASWWLSEKSLNLCTENLGSETGSDFVENSIFSSPPLSTSTENYNNKIQVKKEQRQTRNRRVPETKKQLPPPLTILTGPECLDIRPQREDGRLILKAIRTAPARRSCFLVDRSNGSLRLSLADSRMNMHSSKEEGNIVRNDQKVTNNNEGKYDEKAACSGKLMDHVEHVDQMAKKYLLDQQITRAASSCCRCKESHKTTTNKNTKNNGLMTSMVKLEPPRFLVASS